MKFQKEKEKKGDKSFGGKKWPKFPQILLK